MIKQLLDDFIKNSTDILADNLTGIYLHGSAAMGCFNEKTSDIDLIVVVKKSVSPDDKRRYMDMVTALNTKAPPKGLELSIVKESVCNPFVYPTPFELHFSIAHLKWYLSNPEDYILKMNGTDKDLAAHFTIIYHRGITLYGKDIKSVFAPVGNDEYMDSIWYDIQNAKEDIIENTVYITLNLCRALAYKKEKLILSKAEGALWAISKTEDTHYKDIILSALAGYNGENARSIDSATAVCFAEHMLKLIQE